jgi:hypothetical protein
MPRVQNKRGTAANLTSVDPTPLAGELLVVSDENSLKIGNGTDSYTSLSYVTATPRDGSVTTAKIADDAVTYAKIQNVSATDRLLGRSSSGAGNVEEITCTAFGRSLIDDADAAAGRTTLAAAPTASPTFTGVVTASIGSVGGSLTQTPSSTSGEAIRLASSATAGTGNYGAQIAWSRLGDGNGRRAAIGSVQTASDQDQVGLVFFAHSSDSSTVEMYEAMRLTHDGRLGIGTTSPSSLLHVAGVITVSAGTAALPALVPSGDANTGILFPAADTVAISTAGSERVRVKDNGVVRYVPIATEPSTAEAGDVYYHSGLRRMRMYNGFRWQSLAVSGQEWNVSAASFVRSFSVAAKETTPQGVFFKPDGLKMYIIGSESDSVHEYNLTIAWDISTAAFLQSFSVSSQDTSPTGVFFRPTGLKMYVAGDQGNDINEYTLSTAWDISTATYAQAYVINSQEANIAGIYFRDDGLKLYMTGVLSDNVNEYTLSTAWDVSTATFVQAFSVAGQETGPQGLFFKPDGRRMYIMGSIGDDVTEYDLSTAWDISTATHTTERSVQAQDNDPRCVFFRPDGLMMYIAGAQNDSVYQYTLQ